MTRTPVALALTIALLTAGALPVHAQTRSSGKTALWTIVGAGAGYGLGLFLGLNAFDDAINSDRKVWTSALVGAAAGGTAGYLIGRSRRPASAPVVTAPLSEREVRALAAAAPVKRLSSHRRAMLQSADAYSTARQF